MALPGLTPESDSTIVPRCDSPPKRSVNAMPLGLSAFAFTTFLLGLINVHAGGVIAPNIVVAAAYAYGGLVQLLAGMWEMAMGNTVNATALSSYAGFWISFAIIMTPGGFEIVQSLGGEGQQFYESFGFFLMCWFVFTSLMVLATLRTTLALFALFLALDLAFLLLGAGYLSRTDGAPDAGLITAGGAFCIVSGLLAWYNALAALLTGDNSFFIVPVFPFPWAVKPTVISKEHFV